MREFPKAHTNNQYKKMQITFPIIIYQKARSAFQSHIAEFS